MFLHYIMSLSVFTLCAFADYPDKRTPTFLSKDPLSRFFIQGVCPEGYETYSFRDYKQYPTPAAIDIIGTLECDLSVAILSISRLPFVGSPSSFIWKKEEYIVPYRKDDNLRVKKTYYASDNEYDPHNEPELHQELIFNELLSDLFNKPSNFELNDTKTFRVINFINKNDTRQLYDQFHKAPTSTFSMSVIQFLDKKNRPVTPSSMGYHQEIDLIYRKMNQKRYYDTDDKPISNKYGFHSVTRYFETEDLITFEAYYDHKGNPVDVTRKHNFLADETIPSATYHKFCTKLRREGGMKLKHIFDGYNIENTFRVRSIEKDKKPFLFDRIHKMIFRIFSEKELETKLYTTYDLEYAAFYNSKGQLCKGIHGWAKRIITYYDNTGPFFPGLSIKSICYYDENDHLTSNHYLRMAEARYSRPWMGKQKIKYYDEKGKEIDFTKRHLFVDQEAESHSGFHLQYIEYK